MQRKAEDAEAPVDLWCGKYRKGFPEEGLIGVEFTPERMVYKGGVIFDAYNTTVGIGLVAPVQPAQTLAGKIIAGAGNQVAVPQQRQRLLNTIVCTGEERVCLRCLSNR